jgi:hypothetical protein
MFKNIIIINLIFVVSACQTSSKRGLEVPPDNKNIIGGLPEDLQSTVNSFLTCKDSIKFCSVSKKTANECDWGKLLNDHFPDASFRRPQGLAQDPDMAIERRYCSALPKTKRLAKSSYAQNAFKLPAVSQGEVCLGLCRSIY